MILGAIAGELGAVGEPEPRTVHELDGANAAATGTERSLKLHTVVTDGADGAEAGDGNTTRLHQFEP